MRSGFRPLLTLLLLAACIDATVDVTLGALLGLGRAKASTDATAGSGRPRAGDRAPTFVLKTVDKGETRSLDGMMRGAETRGVVLVFLSCRCPYVAQAREPLAELSKRYASRIAFVGINANQNESADDIKADSIARFSFPVLRDEGARVADLYGAERTPEVFLIDAKGIVRYHGGVADLDAALTDLAAGRDIARPEARAFGCTIKRKA